MLTASVSNWSSAPLKALSRAASNEPSVVQSENKELSHSSPNTDDLWVGDCIWHILLRYSQCELRKLWRKQDKEMPQSRFDREHESGQGTLSTLEVLKSGKMMQHMLSQESTSLNQFYFFLVRCVYQNWLVVCLSVTPRIWFILRNRIREFISSFLKKNVN